MPTRPPVHVPLGQPTTPTPRPNPRRRGGYDHAWNKLRADFLAANPLCERHLDLGAFVKATEIHHVVGVADAPERRLDWVNLQALCASCHSSVTADRQPR